jgi:hypothetical protein
MRGDFQLSDELPKHLRDTLTSLAGEHAVVAKLCLNNYVASMMLKNFPGVDVFYQNPKSGKKGSLQVKATKASWIRVPADGDPDQLFVLVNFGVEPTEFFILPYSKLLELGKLERHLMVTTEKHRRPLKEEEQPLSITLPRYAKYSGYDEVTTELDKFRDKWEDLEKYSS